MHRAAVTTYLPNMLGYQNKPLHALLCVLVCWNNGMLVITQQ